MYSMNFYLKLLIVLLSIIITIISNSFIVLWLLLFILTFINFWSHNRIQFIIDLCLILLLAVASRISSLLVLYKLLFIFNIVFSLVESFTTNEKKWLNELFKKDNSSLRERYYANNYNCIYEYNEKMRNANYSDDISFDNKISSDLERHYLQARIRFYGYKKEIESFTWNKIDIIILIFSLFVFIILLYVGR